MGAGSKIASGTLFILGSACLLVLVFGGIAVAVILSLIPSYLSTKSVTPLGEKYCISNLYLNATYNGTSPYGNFSSPYANTSYLLSQACYRILENYYADTLLSSCLLSNCSVSNSYNLTNGYVSPIVSCYAVIYYSARCTDEAPNSGLNYNINATSNSVCRKKRMSRINAALGPSTPVEYTNVVGLTVSGILIPIKSVYTVAFTNYTQVGAAYCGTITQTAITSAVNAQATG